MFDDRSEAGRLLGAALVSYANHATAVVLGVPRGGVVVAAEIARALHLPLDIVVASKLGAPGNPEFAVGAIDEDGVVLTNPAAPVSAEYLERVGAERLAEVARRAHAYRAGRAPLDVHDRTAIIVDDGIATGLTTRAAIGYLRRHGAARVVVATPVAPPDTVEALGREADEVVALVTPRDFSAVGRWYREFTQTSDAEVIAALASAG
ncbi:MAG: phosphoribosyl transferase [Actinobacteria bacterium HGW-Actinobacteria-1]|nr:MAG: phosphoribosyl transferase [Actinobacteria bacterium HGW-Actinobacteria-1]